ncbi:hypothetical protein Dda_1549 [Drechslerella dactyloides]|uniref:Uncharacterized protein n=1 Tax=Drechslerella dactyloides TaxID=74499 RepID=A0AAD6NKQ8_DREDA|nr:hypothetical protein Dda_1549 [Drechslerella dactyloides]
MNEEQSQSIFYDRDGRLPGNHQRSRPSSRFQSFQSESYQHIPADDGFHRQINDGSRFTSIQGHRQQFPVESQNATDTSIPPINVATTTLSDALHAPQDQNDYYFLPLDLLDSPENSLPHLNAGLPFMVTQPGLPRPERPANELPPTQSAIGAREMYAPPYHQSPAAASTDLDGFSTQANYDASSVQPLNSPLGNQSETESRYADRISSTSRTQESVGNNYTVQEDVDGSSFTISARGLIALIDAAQERPPYSSPRADATATGEDLTVHAEHGHYEAEDNSRYDRSPPRGSTPRAISQGTQTTVTLKSTDSQTNPTQANSWFVDISATATWVLIVALIVRFLFA